MRCVGLILSFLISPLFGWAQPCLPIDSTFVHANTATGLTLYQQRTPIRATLPLNQPIRLTDWQQVTSVHYGNESLHGRAFFRCQATTNRTLWLELTSHYLDTIRVSLLRSDTLIQYPAIRYSHLAMAPTTRLPFLPVRHRYFVFALPLRSNQPTTIFIEGRIAPEDHLKFGVQLWEPGHFLAHQQVDTALWAFFGGIYLMAALISLLNFVLDRQRIFLFYAAYVVFLTAYALLNDGWGTFLPASMQGLDNRYVFAHCLNLGLCSFLLFSHQFLALPRLTVQQWANPYWLLLLVAGLVEVVRYGHTAWPQSYSSFRVGLLSAIGYAVLFLYYVRVSLRQNTNSAPALFLIIAVLSMVAYYATNLIFNAIGYPSPIPDMLLFRIAFLAELLILTLGWLYRQRFIRHRQLALEVHNRQQAEHLNQAQTDLLNAQETERRRLAQDLHDDIGTSLLALRGKLSATNPDAHHLLDQIITDIRAVSHNLMPDELATLGLAGAVGEATRRLQESSHIRFMFVSAGEVVPLSPVAELAVYRAVLELMHNVVKHSRATECVVQLVYHPDVLNVTIEDNGQGFANKDGRDSSGIGLKSVASRTEWLGGKLAIDTSAVGTTIRLDVPYDSRAT